MGEVLGLRREATPLSAERKVAQTGPIGERITVSTSDFEVVSVRHHLHRHPELSFAEFDTTAYVREQLQNLGVEIVETGLETGVIAEIRGEREGPTVALRADIDGLPIREDEGLVLRSKNDGVMHGCGHDLHTASLLGAAAELVRRRDEIAGTIRFVFQPAEETGDGSSAVINTGVLDGVSAIIGCHNYPGLKPGQIAVGEAMMAGCVHFAVSLRAAGTHAGYPHKGTGPLEALATIILALQSIVSRNVSALDPAVLSVTEVHGGHVWNVIPAEAGFSGTVRTFSEGVEELMGRRFHEIVTSIAQGYGVEAEITWELLARPLVNDSQLLDVIGAEIDSYAVRSEYQPSMGGEDFAAYTHLLPGLFAFVGSNGEPGAADWHSPKFVVLDEALPTAIDFFVHSAFAALAQFSR